MRGRRGANVPGEPGPLGFALASTTQQRLGRVGWGVFWRHVGRRLVCVGVSHSRAISEP